MAGSAPPPGGEIGPGLLLDQFRIIAALGWGGMGAVYAAEDTLLRRTVAIKVLPGSAIGDDTELALLLREAQALSRLDHPHIVRLHHASRWPGGYYLVLELMPGGDLQSRLGANRPLPWLEATQAVADACRGLAAAHAAGFLHRDVKPSNLMVDRVGRVKLADFGLVRGGDLTLSTATHLVGTPHFMSPEQCRNEPADERSDLYALGATYFALLTGQAPFPRGSAVQVMFAHCTAPVPDPCLTVPDLPRACADVIRKALAKEPADRFQSADEMLAALEAVAGPQGEAVRATPRASRQVSPRRRLVAAGAAGLALLGAVLAVVLAVRWWGPATGRNAVSDTKGKGGGSVAETGPDEPFDPAIPLDGRVISLGGKVRAVAFSPNNRLFAAGVAEQPADQHHTLGATVWDRRTGKVIRRLWRGRTVLCLNFAPTMEGIQRGGDDGAVIWHMNTDEEFDYRPIRLKGAIRAVAMPRDGSFVALGFASGEQQGQVYQYAYPDAKKFTLRPLGSRGPAVEQLAFSPWDGTLGVAHQDGTLRLWAARQAKPLLHPPAVNQAPGLAFHPKGPVLAYTNGKAVQLWDYKANKPAGQTIEVQGEALIVGYTPDGKYLAVGEAGGDVTLWDVAGRKRVHTFRGHQGEVLGLAVSPDGQHLATGGADGTARLWDLRGALAAAGREQP